ncbi:helix-turn-helix transcriptional regulator [Nesterenkonia marinintestina]|uniref:helix-turn-helix transcriptional regulator n=1 Tax=Nesterenkonia marinintestina TaxID=2979865 RepID=UPI0021BEA551|nr:helix-turn-helix transcriptional regulator [Nesterenkonia sp. GX14115]
MTDANDQSRAEGIDHNIARSIKSRRDVLGWSQKKLADELKAGGLRIHQQAVNNIENGHRAVKVGEAVVIAEVLGVTFEDLTRVQPRLGISQSYWAAVPTRDHLVDAVSEMIAAVDRLQFDLDNDGILRQNTLGFGEDFTEDARRFLDRTGPVRVAERALLRWILDEYNAGVHPDPRTTENYADGAMELVAALVEDNAALQHRWWYADLQRLRGLDDAPST